MKAWAVCETVKVQVQRRYSRFLRIHTGTQRRDNREELCRHDPELAEASYILGGPGFLELCELLLKVHRRVLEDRSTSDGYVGREQE